MVSPDLTDKVALVTGGANGIGHSAARHLAAAGARVVVADVDTAGSQQVADEVGGVFVPCDVREPEHTNAVVDTAVQQFGGLDIAFLNAGVATTRVGVGEDFDLAAYRRAMAVNVDGVFFGVHAAVPALQARGGGAIVLTASLAGLTAVPMDPVYCANKHAVVGLARALGPRLAPDRIAVNALCPGFADTAITEGFRDVISAAGIPLMQADQVAGALMDVLASDETGQAWYVQPGRSAGPFRFSNVPGPRSEDGAPVGGPLRDQGSA